MADGSNQTAGRLYSLLGHTSTALRELRTTERADELSGELALIWRYRLGPVERTFLLMVAAQAADKEDVEELGFILGGPPPFGDGL